ncbi:DUF2721 domain-containing protein [Patescibacteria group bacterium]|nr:MAG: DUF2721 domain-containing protein [Patescibacteria group bacterium]
MELTLTTSSLLFLAISLLLLAYTNRYLSVTEVIRTIRRDHDSGFKRDAMVKQVGLLDKRLDIVCNMQVGTASLALASLTVLLICIDQQTLARGAFGASIVLLIMSMMILLHETMLSNEAIGYEIDDLLAKEHARPDDQQ